ncbi:hypothetical protein GOODEAATRI_025718 [Goodea atripinnis]|uniref:Uncharacterized protein n=1 Tax=Goodea atripinnis TaxID=208336 RepID=A0ABV0N597_9TELE
MKTFLPSTGSAGGSCCLYQGFPIVLHSNHILRGPEGCGERQGLHRAGMHSTMHAALCTCVFLLCLIFLAEAKRQPVQDKQEKPHQPQSSPPPARRTRNRSVLSSGELTTKQGHRCTWQTSGEGLVSLLVNCSIETDGDLER